MNKWEVMGMMRELGNGKFCDVNVYFSYNFWEIPNCIWAFESFYLIKLNAAPRIPLRPHMNLIFNHSQTEMRIHISTMTSLSFEAKAKWQNMNNNSSVPFENINDLYANR